MQIKQQKKIEPNKLQQKVLRKEKKLPKNQRKQAKKNVITEKKKLGDQVTNQNKKNNSKKGKILSLDVSALFVSQVIAFGLSTLIPLILSRTISPHTYGVYRELLLFWTFLNPIFLLGIPLGIKYFYTRFDTKKKKLFLTQTVFIIVFASFLFLVTLVSIGVIGSYFIFEPSWTIYFILLGLYAFFNLNTEPFITILVVSDRVKLASWIFIVFSIIDVVLISLLGIVFKSIIALLWAMVIADLIKFLIFFSFAYKKGLTSFTNIQPKFIKKILAYSLPLGIYSFIGIINSSVDKYFIALYYAPSIYMLYHFGSYQLPPLRMLLSAISKVLVPEMSKEHKNKKFQNIIVVWHETLRKMSMVFFPLFGFLMIATSEILVVFVTKEYLDAVPIFRIYLLLVPVRVFFFAWIIMAMGQAKFLFKLSLVTLVANFILNYLFLTYIEYIGITALYGPAIATVLVIYGSTVVNYYKTKSEMSKYTDASLGPWAVIIKIGIITAITSIITYFVAYILLYNFLVVFHPIVILLFTFGIFSGCYFVLMRLTKLINKDDISSVKLFISGKF